MHPDGLQDSKADVYAVEKCNRYLVYTKLNGK
jgi:hypothetical protein